MSDQQKTQAADKATKKEEEKKGEEVQEEVLNEEDQMLKEKLELLVERLTDKDLAQRENGFSQIKEEIAGATKTITSVPKPLKFLTPLYPKLIEAYEAEKEAALKVSYTLVEVSLMLTENCCLHALF